MSRRIARVLWLAFVPVLLALSGPSHAQDPIGFGDTIQQQLDSEDPVTQGGAAFDAYTFTAEPGQSYVITGNSSELPLFLSLYRVQEAEQALALIQGAFVNAPNRQVQFSGVLDEAGTYLIFVQSNDPALLGAYTVGLAEQVPGGAASCTGGTRAEPIPITLGASLSCQLSADDVAFSNQLGDTFFGKFFLLESTGGTLTITAASDEIAPFIQVYADPGSTDVVAFGEGAVTADVPSGPVLFAVLNLIPEGVGAFTVSVEAGDGTP